MGRCSSSLRPGRGREGRTTSGPTRWSDPTGTPSRRTPELSGVEAFGFHLAHLPEGEHADLEVLGDLVLVELRGHAGELELALERLVGHAEEGAVGHPQAKAVGRDRRRLHVEGDGARLGQAAHRLALVLQLPVAVVDRGDGAGAHDALELVALEPGDFRDGRLERLLHFGERRDRHPDGDVVVEHLVLPDVGVGEHVVAERLGVPEARAVPEHEPGVRAEDGHVIGDRLRVGRADADVDQRDAAALRGDEVVRRHLRLARRHGARGGRALAASRHAIAGFDEGGVLAVAGGHALAREAAELVDVELVVREQDVVLEVTGGGAGVVHEAVQRVVDALGGERGERPRSAGRRLVGAVDDVVVDVGDVGHVERVAERHRQRLRVLALERGARLEREVQRNLHRGLADLDARAVVADQQIELVGQVAPEQRRLRDRRRVEPRVVDVAVGQPGVDARVGIVPEPHLGVERPVTPARGLAVEVAGEGLAEERRVALVDLDEARDGGDRVGERDGLDVRRGDRSGGAVLHALAGCWRGALYHADRDRPMTRPGAAQPGATPVAAGRR